jgi:hypothetical protein
MYNAPLYRREREREREREGGGGCEHEGGIVKHQQQRKDFENMFGFGFGLRGPRQDNGSAFVYLQKTALVLLAGAKAYQEERERKKI